MALNVRTYRMLYVLALNFFYLALYTGNCLTLQLLVLGTWFYEHP